VEIEMRVCGGGVKWKIEMENGSKMGVKWE
jgi:hypothetical protein